MERKEEQQERSQNIEENIPEAKNSFLRHSQIQSLGLDRVDSGTEEQWKPRATRVHFTKDTCRVDKREMSRGKGQKTKQNKTKGDEKEGGLSILKCSQVMLVFKLLLGTNL